MADPTPRPTGPVEAAPTAPAPAPTPLSNPDFRTYARTKATDMGLPPDIVEGLFDHESGFDPAIQSHTKATGIGQLTRATARAYGLRVDAKVDERKDPYKNMDASIAYLRDINNAHPEQKWSQKIMAYNMGLPRYGQYVAGKIKLDPANNWKDKDALDFPNLVQNKIVAIKQYRGAQPQAAVAASGAVTADPNAVTVDPTEVTVGPEPDHSLTGQYLSGLPPALQAMAYGVEQAGRLAGEVGKQTLESATQFPAEVFQASAAAGHNVGTALRNATFGGPPEPYETVPGIDPMGAINFATLPLAPVTGRVRNAVVSGGLGVLNTADGLARERVVSEGKNWDDLSFAERASRIGAEVTNSDNAIPLVQSALGGAAIGALTGGNPKAAREARWEKGHYNRLEAEELLKVQRQKIFMPTEERRQANLEVRRALENRFFIEKVNPGKVHLDELQEKFGMRELDDRIAGIDDKLAAIRKTAERRGLLKGDPNSIAAIEKLTEPLDQARELQKQYDALMAKIRAGAGASPGPMAASSSSTKNAWNRGAMIARAMALKEKIDAIPIPTVNDLVDRMQNFDRLRRSKFFKKAIGDNDEGFLNLLAEASNAFRAPDGLIDQALDHEERKLWRVGSNLTRNWYQDRRTLRLIAMKFRDGQSGGGPLRDLLTSDKKEAILEKIGATNYEHLLGLARAADVLSSKNEHGQKAYRFLAEGYARLRSPLGLAALGTAVGGPTAGLIVGGMSSLLLTNRTAARAFEKTMRYADKMSSNQFSRAAARFFTAAMIHNSYVPNDPTPIDEEDDADETSAERKEFRAKRPSPRPTPTPLPPIAGARTGPIPAPPSSGLAAGPTPRVLGMSALG